MSTSVSSCQDGGRRAPAIFSFVPISVSAMARFVCTIAKFGAAACALSYASTASLSLPWQQHRNTDQVTGWPQQHEMQGMSPHVVICTRNLKRSFAKNT